MVVKSKPMMSLVSKTDDQSLRPDSSDAQPFNFCGKAPSAREEGFQVVHVGIVKL